MESTKKRKDLTLVFFLRYLVRGEGLAEIAIPIQPAKEDAEPEAGSIATTEVTDGT